MLTTTVTLRKELIVIGALAIVGLATASTVSFATTAAPSRHAWPSGCPRQAVTNRRTNWTPLDLAAAAKAVHAQLPRVFGQLRSQGQPAWHNGIVTALIAAYGTGSPPDRSVPPLNGTRYYWKAAVRACGRATAQASLVAFIQFPECQIPCAYNVAYITKTRRGWHMWTSYHV